MLESYYVRPQAVGRIRASWIGSEIERYVVWLAEQRYSRRSVRRRVPVLVAFGEFARAGGARSIGELAMFHVTLSVHRPLARSSVVKTAGLPRNTAAGKEPTSCL